MSDEAIFLLSTAHARRLWLTPGAAQQGLDHVFQEVPRRSTRHVQCTCCKCVNVSMSMPHPISFFNMPIICQYQCQCLIQFHMPISMSMPQQTVTWNWMRRWLWYLLVSMLSINSWMTSMLHSPNVHLGSITGVCGSQRLSYVSPASHTSVWSGPPLNLMLDLSTPNG